MSNDDDDYVTISILTPITPPSSEKRLEKKGYDLRKSWTRPEITANPTAAWCRAALRILATEFSDYWLSAVLDGPLPFRSMDLSAELMFVVASQADTVLLVSNQVLTLNAGDAVVLRVDRLQEIRASHYLFVLAV
jgi:hypothetical protein